MGKNKEPVTQAIRLLRQHKVDFEGHPYSYIDGGGTAQFAREMGVDEHRVIKTLIMERDDGAPLIALMHGDREVSTRKLARAIGCKNVQSCAPKVADKHSGYQVGGTSPFGTRKAMPVYCHQSITDLDLIYINGGKRGYIISLATADLLRVLEPSLVDMEA